jgi:hypothetical protein
MYLSYDSKPIPWYKTGIASWNGWVYICPACGLIVNEEDFGKTIRRRGC